MPQCDTSVIIAAAGGSTRMKGVFPDKLSADLCGLTVLERSMLAFQNCESVAEIIVVTKTDRFAAVESSAKKLVIEKFSCCAAGGDTRQESVIAGLSKCSRETKYIAIHDGARPLVNPAHIEKTIADARIFGGATLGVPVKDTIKQVDDGLIVDTPPRSSLFAVQTPQVFLKRHYFEGVDFAREHGLDFTDDCQLVEAIGIKVAVTVGDYKNIKITTPEDVYIARAIIEGQTGE